MHLKGDWGGPLICENKLAGIASWSSGCGYEDFPTVFTSVPPYYNWIHPFTHLNKTPLYCILQG